MRFLEAFVLAFAIFGIFAGPLPAADRTADRGDQPLIEQPLKVSDASLSAGSRDVDLRLSANASAMGDPRPALLD